MSTFYKRALCITAIITLFCTTAYAQYESKSFELGIRAGASLNTYTGDDMQDADMKVGFNVGITGRYFFYNNLFGELSLGFATKGYKQNTNASSGQYWDDHGANYDSEVNKNMTTYNLDIPLYIGYRIPLSDNSNLCIKAGPYITYALSGKLKTSGYIITYPDIHSSEKESISEEKK
ncbi:MAG: PorT family protein [Muribaculaceae bacterium]|nr:PorT family protein [Muribaculaceae bacterium]